MAVSKIFLNSAYSMFSGWLQRCWSHLLREAKWMAEINAVEARCCMRDCVAVFWIVWVFCGDPSLAVWFRLLVLGWCRFSIGWLSVMRVRWLRNLFKRIVMLWALV